MNILFSVKKYINHVLLKTFTSLASCLLMPNLQIVPTAYTAQWQTQTLTELRGGGSVLFFFLLALLASLPSIIFHFHPKLEGAGLCPSIRHCFTLHVAVTFCNAEISGRIDHFCGRTGWGTAYTKLPA